MRKRKIKFPLILKDNTKVRTLEDLRQFFDLDKIMGYYADSKLEIWLRDRYEDEIAEEISDIDKNAPNIAELICNALGVSAENTASISIADVQSRNEKIQKLKMLTDDANVINNSDKAVFSQMELNDLLKKNPDVIYLCGGEYIILPEFGNIRFVGINNPKVKWMKHFESEYTKINVTFENVFLVDKEARLSQVREITNDKNILDNYENVAFTQEALDKILLRSPKVVYLIYGEYIILPKFKNVKFIGVNNPKIKWEKHLEYEYTNMNITFENVFLVEKEAQLSRIREVTSQKNVLDNYENVAFTQSELDKILLRKPEVVYLYGDSFTVLPTVNNVKLVGLNRAKVDFKGHTFMEYHDAGIEFQNLLTQPSPVNGKNIGDIIKFGKVNKEIIEWEIIAIESNKALIISKYLLRLMAFSQKRRKWEDSLIYEWLHSDSFVFELEEQLYIINDGLFILSRSEVEEYLKNEHSRIACFKYEDLGDRWWLRDIISDNNVMFVTGGGRFNDTYYNMKLAVRPAMWISL